MADVKCTSKETETGQYAEVQDTYVYILDQDVHVQNNNTNYQREITNHAPPPSIRPQVVIQPVRVTSPCDFLFLSVFSCLCCIWPIGAVAICFSRMSRSAKHEGDISSARKYGHIALRLSIFSIVGGIIIISFWLSYSIN